MLPKWRVTFFSLFLSILVGSCGGGGSKEKTQLVVGENASNVIAAPTSTPTASTNSDTPQPASSVQEQNDTVQRENAKSAEQGVSTQWQIADGDYASAGEIEGYASATSVNRGESIKLYVNTASPEYTIAIYRIGWYGGKGGRLVAGPVQRKGFLQPAPTRDLATNLVECDWTDPYVVSIPASSDSTEWASGVYLAKLTASSGKQSYIIFTVRDDKRHSALLFQSSVTTYAAYNNWGGYSFYDADDSESNNNNDDGKFAYKVSFNRPYRNPDQPFNGKGAGDFLSWEINMVRFLEREGFDVGYSTNIDTDRAPGELRKHRGFLSVGHDEYWTKNMRDGMEAARDQGVNLAFFGANSGYWQIRLEPATRTKEPSRTVVGYKYATKAHDPMYLTNPALSTYLWREPNDPSINRPEASLVGVMYDYNSVDLDMVIADCLSWICAGTGLQKGTILKGMLGYEVDTVALSSPAGITMLASSPYTVCADANCTSKHTRYANMTYYTASSGAGVFATGSMNWHWGLDSFGPHGDRVNPAVQRMTHNVLSRFVAQ